MDKRNLDELRTIAELNDYQKEVRGRLSELNTEHKGLPFPDDARAEFEGMKEQDREIGLRIVELEGREAYIEALSKNERAIERVGQDVDRATRVSSRDADIYRTDDIMPGERGVSMVIDRAMRAVELATFPQAESREKAQAHVKRLLDSDDARATIGWRVLTTAGPLYNRAFWKSLSKQPMTNDEARALSLTGASGGFAVPFDLDPTIIPTSNGAVNPIRAMARVVQIAGDEWRGVSSGAITAAYAAEATETTDNAPTLAQPTISTEKAQAFIPFSIEVGMDWGGLRGEMGGLLQDAKDELEAAKFTSGSGTNEPFGLLTGITNTVNAAAGQTFTLANLYALRNALPPRYQPRAAYMGNLAVEGRVRQFDTAGGAALWQTLGNDTPERLLGRPFAQNSAMLDVATGVQFLVYGDFSRYVIADRIGLEIELIPHLMGTNRRPTGQRGLYAFWRNGAKVVDANAFRALLGVA